MSSHLGVGGGVGATPSSVDRESYRLLALTPSDESDDVPDLDLGPPVQVSNTGEENGTQRTKRRIRRKR